MPIATKLSRRLDEVLGSEAAEVMVDWMQRVDSGRNELRELNELNFARLESRFAAIDTRFAAVDARFAAVDARFEALDKKLDAAIEVLNDRIGASATELRLEMQAGFARMETMMARNTLTLTRWALGAWLASLIAIVGTLVAVARLPR